MHCWLCSEVPHEYKTKSLWVLCTLGLTCASLFGEYGGLSADCKWRRATTIISTTVSSTTATPTEMAAAIITFCLDIWSTSEMALTVLSVVLAEEGTGVEVTSESAMAATVENVLRLGDDDIIDIIDVDDVVDLLPPSHAETELPVYNTKLYNDYWLRTYNYTYLLRI